MVASWLSKENTVPSVHDEVIPQEIFPGYRASVIQIRFVNEPWQPGGHLME